MLIYCLKCLSFDFFLGRVLDEVILKDGNGLVVISDLSLYEDFVYKSQDSNLTVTQYNNISRIDILLINSIYELEDFLIEMLQKGLQANQQLYHNSPVIGIYGFFSHYLNEGTGIYNNLTDLKGISNDKISEIYSKPSFLTIEDFSAKKINFICNLMYNVAVHSNSTIVMTDPIPKKDVPYFVTSPWEASIPNLSLLDYLDCNQSQDEKESLSPPVFPSTTNRHCVSFAESRTPTKVPLSLILSKWFTFNFH